MSYHVPVSSIPLLQDPPFVLLLVWLATAIGRRVLRLLRAPLGQVSALERGVLSAALGLGLLPFGPFLLGMAGVLFPSARLLTPGAVWLLLAVLLVLFAPDLWAVARGVWRAACRLRRPPVWLLACALVLAVPLAVAFLQALCPPTDYDGVHYHLAAVKRWLQFGNLGYLPTIIQSQWPMGVEMLFTLALAVWSDTAARLIHFALGALALLAIYALGRRLRHPALGFTAAFLFMLGAPRIYNLQNFTYTGADLGITFETVSAVLAWLLWSRSKARGWLWCAALCAGFAASFKLTGAFTGLALAGLTLREYTGEGVGWRRAAGVSAGFFGLSVLPLLFWLGRSWLLTGNPVWPFLAAVFPTRDWSAEATRGFDFYFRYTNWGGRFMRSASLERKQMARLLVMGGVAACAAGTLWRWRDRDGRALAAVAAVLALATLWSSGLYARFFMPVLPLLLLALLLPLSGPLASSRWARAAVLLLVVANTALILRGGAYSQREAIVSATGRDITAGEAWSVATGRTPRTEYLARNLPVTRMWDYANRSLPPGARVFAPGFAAAYYSDPYCYSPDYFGPGRFRSDTLEHFASDLRREGIGYIAFSSGSEGGASGPADPNDPLRNQAVLNRYAHALVRESRPLYAEGDQRLYRLDSRLTRF